MTFTLYHHGSSVCAAKVRFAMDEKKLEWDGVYIDILKGEQFEPEYLKLNPKGVVPTLVHDNLVIPDSTVIIEYLDQIAPESSVHPTDPWERAQVRYWTKAVDEDLHPACGAVTFVCSHRHTVLKNLGPEGVKEFLASTPKISVTSDWKSQKDAFVRHGFKAPGAAEKVKLYDTYLHKMEDALSGGDDWLVGNRFLGRRHRHDALCQSPCDDVDARHVGGRAPAECRALVRPDRGATELQEVPDRLGA